MVDGDDDGRAELAQYVGSRIRSRRTALGMSENDLAAKSGIDAVLIRAYEVGEGLPTAPDMIKMSRAFGVPLGFFFPGYDRLAGEDTPDATPN